jgi:hypothetical protein
MQRNTECSLISRKTALCAVICKSKEELKKINGKLKLFRNEVINSLDGEVGSYLNVFYRMC